MARRQRVLHLPERPLSRVEPRLPATGVMVLHREGERARAALEPLRRLARRLVLIHDGPADETTRRLCIEFADEFLEFDRAGCKEPHLVRFFSELRGDHRWFIHVDTDEIISRELEQALRRASLDKATAYWAQIAHTRSDGQVLKYSSESVARGIKPVLFHADAIVEVVGMPHHGLHLAAERTPVDGQLIHRAVHVDYGFAEFLRRELRFVIVDADWRTRPIMVYRRGATFFRQPSSPESRWVDRWRYQFPLLTLPACLLWRAAQSVRWLLDARSWPAFLEQLKRTGTILPYQAILLFLIWRNKRERKGLPT